MYFNMIFLWVLLLYFLNGIRKTECQGGIVFQPFVQNGDDPDYSTLYTKNDVKVVLELILVDNFHFIATLSVGAPNEPYKPDSTWKKCSSSVHAAVAAAEINRERQSNLLLIYQGLFLSYVNPVESEIEVAFEVAHAANNISKGTVPGLIITQSSFWQISSRLEIVSNISARAQTAGLKLGVRISDCESAIPTLDSWHQNTLKFFQFIIWERTPTNSTIISLGPQLFKEMVTKDILKVENAVKNMGIKTQVILETGWPGDDKLGQNATVADMFLFWKLIQDWSLTRKRIVFMNEAIDNPWRNVETVKVENSISTPRTNSLWGGHYGLWKHLETEDNSKNAYVPKQANSTPNLGENGNGGGVITRASVGGGGGAVDCADAGFGVVACSSAGGNGVVAIAGGHGRAEHGVTENGTNTELIIGSILGSVLLVLTVVIIMIALLYRRVKKLKHSKLIKEEIHQFLNGNGRNVYNEHGMESGESHWERGPYNRELELEKHSFSIDKGIPLGSGAFGSVYKGRISGVENEIAFKTTRSDCPAFALRGLLSEIKILSHLGKHENIVSICGAYTAELEKGIIYVATELCSNGSLEKYLRNLKTDPIPTAPVPTEIQLFRWSLEIATAMKYITSKNVIHADLAARNVLLTSDLTAKITDFGLSRRLYEYTEYVKHNQEPLPWRWMAVESLRRLEFSSKTDMWAYGITVWEIWSLGDIPYSGRSWDINFVAELENGMRNSKPSMMHSKIFEIVSSTWNFKHNLFIMNISKTKKLFP